MKSLNQTTPVELTINDNINGVNTLIIQNTSDTEYVYLGCDGVSQYNYGFMLYPRQAFTVELRPFDRIYGVSSAEVSIPCMSIERST